MNIVMLAGNLGKDTELRFSKDGLPICKLSMAVDNFVRGGIEPLWLNVTLFGASAENAHKILSKGSGVVIQAHLQKRSWQDDDGKNVSVLEIICDRWKKMGGGSGKDDNGGESWQENDNSGDNSASWGETTKNSGTKYDF